MKALSKIISLTSLLAMMCLPLKAQSEAITPNNNSKESTKYALIDNSFTNKNMFFGMNFGTMPLHQGYLEVGNKDFVASAWTNYSVNDKHLIEIDLLAAYKHTFKLGENKALTVQPGIMYATFPNSEWSDYREINFKATLTGLPVDLSFRAGKMYGDGFDSKDITDGSMIDVDVSKTVKVSDKISASGNLEAIYNSNYFSGSKGFSHAGVSLSATYSPLENISITGSITGQQKIDPEMAYVNTEGYFKAGITYTFK